MSAFTCPHCRKPFSVPTGASAVRCPHCAGAVELPKTSASRWYFARAKKKYGPYTWQQLQTLAQRGELRPDDMLLQEGSKRWVEAYTLPTLFPQAAPANSTNAVTTAPAKVQRSASPAKVAAAAPKRPSPRPFPWLITSLAAGVFVLLAACGVAGYFLVAGFSSKEPQPDQIAKNGADKKKSEQEPPEKKVDPPRNDDKKKPPDEQKPKPAPTEEWAAAFVEQLNRHRKSAGLAAVTFDAELSRGCQAHAKYLAEHVDPSKAEASSFHAEDPTKAGYTVEGELAGQNGMISFAEPLPALERWMGRLFSRTTLLSPEMQSVGIGRAKNGKGTWVSVLDPARGRGEPIIVYPAPKQVDVPLSFSNGPEVPEPKAAAGYPITVTFPPARQVTGANLELRDDKGTMIAGWLWTPEKPVNPRGQRNTIAFIPKGLLRGSSAYQVKASAQIDGKAWQLAWTFTTQDDVDSKGVWAKKALDMVNKYRASAGLKPVTLDEGMSRACLAHARYLVINEGHPKLQGLNAHDEDLSLPGASEAGRKAGKESDIAIGDYDPLDGVHAWMATLYHRVPILEPNLKSIGFASVRGRRQGWVALLNVGGGRTPGRPHAVFYPAADQTGVPLSFPNDGEEPNPIPDDKTGRAGFPITAFFPQDKALMSAAARLTDGEGTEVPCWFSSREKPANPNFAKFQGNTVCLIPKEPLKANTTYRVELRGTLEGNKWEKQWKFSTGDSGLSVADATRSVLDRLNEYRAQAGLNAVALDEKTGRGCQAHAEYLAQNAVALLKTKASVNDEDPLLPGFTPEGARAARQSDVFTNAPIPVMQIDDLMAAFTRRVYLLDPNLQRIGYGTAHDIGRGWRCVLDHTAGRGDGRIVVYPAPKQVDVPLQGFDRHKDLSDTPGFPISVTFPARASVRNVQAVLTNAQDKNVDVWTSSPEKPLNEKLQRTTIGVHPRAPLQAGQLYTVTVSAIVNGSEWRQTWQFKTKK